MPKKMYEILQYLFAELDFYEPDPELRPHVTRAIDEDQLSRSATAAVAKLRALQAR